MTPLDFRLIAAPVFRLIEVHCTFFRDNINSIRDVSLSDRLVRSQVLSEASFDSQVKAIHEKFIAHMAAELLSSRFSQLIMLIIRQCGIASALHTNIFQMIVPGSNQSVYFPNFYPIHDNGNFTGVSNV
jgi:hypothetical protein